MRRWFFRKKDLFTTKYKYKEGLLVKVQQALGFIYGYIHWILPLSDHKFIATFHFCTRC